MSYRIVHLIKPNLRVRLRLDQLQIEDKETGELRSIPLADVAVVITATREMSISVSVLRRMAELNVLLLVCNEHFEPCSISLPYYRATNTEVLRRQTAWSAEWKEAIWRQLVTAKIYNQATVLRAKPKVYQLLRHIADLCEHSPNDLADDVMEPLRPWADKVLRDHLEAGNSEGDMKTWIPAAANLLALEVRIQKSSIRFLHAIYLLVQSFQHATLKQTALPLNIPLIPDGTVPKISGG